jgi:NADPH:quinone reductase-like Zn-dependent oxidoreductase
MRLYRIPSPGKIDNLTLAEADTPKPGPGQVLVRMRAASLNYRDLAIIRGQYMMGPLPADLVPLSDGAGEVVETGPGVTRVATGDRGAGIFMQAWQGGDMEPHHALSALGGAINGVLSEYVLFDADGLVKIPDHLSFEDGATLPCAAVTAWNALYGLKPLLPGQTVLVLGTGGVSIFALQFAHAAGARVIVTSSSDEKLARATALGASDGINYKATPDWAREVRKLTGGRGVDHVVEVGGPGTLQQSIASARLGGVVSLIGVLTRGQIDPLPILGGGVIVRGIFVGSRSMFEDMNRAIALHGIVPVVDRVFGFEEARDAYRALKSAVHVGKLVIAIPAS